MSDSSHVVECCHATDCTRYARTNTTRSPTIILSLPTHVPLSDLIITFVIVAGEKENEFLHA